MSSTLICSVLLLSLTTVLVFGQAPSHQDVNAAFDQVLNKAMTRYGKTIDPYYVTEKSIGFSTKLAFIKWRARAHLDKIVLDGLGNIHRQGDAILTKNKTATILTAHLYLPVLFFNANSELSLMGFGPRRHLYGQLDDTKIEATIHYDPRIESVYLVNFKIKELKNIRLKIDGPGLVQNAVSNIFVSNTVVVFQRLLRRVVEKGISHVLSKVVAESLILKHIMTSL